ncbi:MAG TPA: hypothetical protein DIU14_08405 [Actinobacteria bacterium]|nr:hypothetical protein [Actinomycetota bacterium]
MQQTPGYGAAGSPAPASSPVFTHSGQIYLLGYTPQAYGIWDRRNPSAPVASFPVTDAGWGTAWQQFSAWEPAAVPVAQLQPAATPSPAPTVAAPVASPAPAVSVSPSLASPEPTTAFTPTATAPATAAPSILDPATVPMVTDAVPEVAPAEAPAPPPPLPSSTGSELPGREIVESLGLCIGVAVRGGGSGKSLGAAFTSFVGSTPQDAAAQSSIAALEEARTRAIGTMMDRAGQLGADAVVAVRFDSSPIGADATEIVAYGTAVTLKESDRSDREHDRGEKKL